ncbi:MAG: SMP-30/gluconolactonase/LRE family protein [Planctomycetota bacterium]
MLPVIEAQPVDLSLSDELRFLPEGPYAVGNGVFSWVGIQHGVDQLCGSINRCDLTTGQNESFPLPGRPGFAFPCQTENRFIVGCERELGFFDTNTLQWSPFENRIDRDVSNTIINDGIFVDEDLIFGTKDLEFATEKAGLYYYDFSEKRLVRLRDDQICSNGKALIRNVDGVSLIDIDSPTRRVVQYSLDRDSLAISEPEVVIDLTDDPAVPDGAILTPDQRSLIVSLFLPQAHAYGETRQYDLATGECQMIWRTPLSPQNTCPALVPVGDSLKLVITTAVENMSKADQAACTNAGKLFIADTSLPSAGFAMPKYPA